MLYLGVYWFCFAYFCHLFKSIWIQLVSVLDWTKLNCKTVMIPLGFSHHFPVAKYDVRILFCLFFFFFFFWLCFLISLPNLYFCGFYFSLPQRLHCCEFEGFEFQIMMILKLFITTSNRVFIYGLWSPSFFPTGVCGFWCNNW